MYVLFHNQVDFIYQGRLGETVHGPDPQIQDQHRYIPRPGRVVHTSICQHLQRNVRLPETGGCPVSATEETLNITSGSAFRERERESDREGERERETSAIVIIGTYICIYYYIAIYKKVYFTRIYLFVYFIMVLKDFSVYLLYVSMYHFFNYVQHC